MTGLAKCSKAKGNVRVVAAQPQPNHKIQGLRIMAGSMMSKVLERRADLIDEWVTVTNDEAFEGVRELSSEFSPFAGQSSGAVYGDARKLETGGGERVVMTLGDSGLKYRMVYPKERRLRRAGDAVVDGEEDLQRVVEQLI